MACAQTTAEHNFFTRLCYLLVDFGSQGLRNVFDKIYPPERLYTVLSQHSVRATLESLLERKILNSQQWGYKLYPVIPSMVTSSDFDSTLLMVLLRSICDLKPPATGWSSWPSTADTSTEADIVRVIHYQNLIAHSTQASLDYNTFSMYWQNICVILVRLGLERYKTDMDDLRNGCMDPSVEDYYQHLLEQWAENENDIKGKLEAMEMERKLSMRESQYEGGARPFASVMQPVPGGARPFAPVMQPVPGGARPFGTDRQRPKCCFNCGGAGHLRWQCPSPPTTKKGGRRGRGGRRGGRRGGFFF